MINTTIDKSLAVKLMAVQVAIIAISNWLVNFKFSFFGHPLVYAAFTFPLVVVATDLTVRLIGKEMGRLVVGISFIPAILISILMVLLSGAPESVAIRIGIGSGTAYLISTLLDVYVFQYFREKYSSWWIAPTFSSIVATVIDTYAFFSVAFINSADQFMAEHWAEVATNHVITKLIVSLLVILPAYGVLLNYLQRKMTKV